MANSVNIENGTVKISGSKAPPFMLIMAICIFFFQSLSFFLKYRKSGETYDLGIGIVVSVFLLLALIKLIFFVSYRTEIPVDEISGVSTQKILFGRGKTYLRLKVSGKTRDVLLENEHAEAIKKELEHKIKRV